MQVNSGVRSRAARRQSPQGKRGAARRTAGPCLGGSGAGRVCRAVARGRHISFGAGLRAVLFLVAVALDPLAGDARIAAAAERMCDVAAQRAADRTGVPVSVLLAITRVETGRTRDGVLQPWPWTVNMEGTGRWFASADAALAYAERHHARGARSFDIGCFQINYRWHGAAFESIAQMFDPGRSALYAARFLARLHAETGDWHAAAGAYHSRTPKYARRYRARFERIHAGLSSGAVGRGEARTAGPARPVDDANGFPLLLSGAPGRAGSLVPRDVDGAGPLFAAE